MKKLLAILILLALLVGSLTACGGSSSDLYDYQAFMQEMTALTEYDFVGDVTLTLGDAFRETRAPEAGFADLEPMRFNVAGSVSHLNDEMTATYTYETADGSPMFDTDLILSDGTMYLGLVSMLDHMLRPVLEALELDASDFQVQDILGDATHLAVPYAKPFPDMVFAPMEMGLGMDLEPFLSRDGGRFTITMLNEDVRIVAGDMGRLLNQFADPGDTEDGLGDLFYDIGDQLAFADLTDAHALLISTRINDTFHQSIDLQVPNFIDMRANFSFTEMDFLSPVSAPANVLSESAFEELFQNLDLAALMGGSNQAAAPGAPGETGVDEITYEENLHHLNLTSPTLPEDSLLATIPMSIQGDPEADHRVLVVYGAPMMERMFSLVIDADAIGMTYTTVTSMTAMQAVLEAVQADRAEVFLPDSLFNFSTLRTNADRSIAVMAIAEETAAGMQRLHIYLAQNLVGIYSGVRLELALYLDFLTDTDHEILAQLSEQFGLDLGAYITALFGGGNDPSPEPPADE